MNFCTSTTNSRLIWLCVCALKFGLYGTVADAVRDAAGADEDPEVFMNKFLSYYEETGERIYSILDHTINPRIAFTLSFLVLAPVPIIHFLYKKFAIKAVEQEPDPETIKNWTILQKIRWMLLPPALRHAMKFEDTPLYHVANLVSQAAKIGSLLYLVDCMMYALSEFGFTPKNYDLHAFSGSMYTVWAASHLTSFKRFLLCKASSRTPENLGSATVVDGLLDVIIYFFALLVILDMFCVKAGMALSSFFTFGGVGTLIFSLASKELATQLVGGIALSTTHAFALGDVVKFGDGTSGKVVKMGWLYTTLRGSDEVIVKIPNSDLHCQRVSNLSRVEKSQVTQTLRMSYDDYGNIHPLVKGIKEKVEQCCPELITDGSRPCRAHLRDLQDYHAFVVFDFHFRCKAGTDQYYDLREKVLQIMLEQAKENNVGFSTQEPLVVTSKT